MICIFVCIENYLRGLCPCDMVGRRGWDAGGVRYEGLLGGLFWVVSEGGRMPALAKLFLCLF